VFRRTPSPRAMPRRVGAGEVATARNPEEAASVTRPSHGRSPPIRSRSDQRLLVQQDPPFPRTLDQNVLLQSPSESNDLRFDVEDGNRSAEEGQVADRRNPRSSVEDVREQKCEESSDCGRMVQNSSSRTAPIEDAARLRV